MNEELIEKLSEPVNPNCEEAIKEIAELLTFLPENMRMGQVIGIAKSLCKS